MGAKELMLGVRAHCYSSAPIPLPAKLSPATSSILDMAGRTTAPSSKHWLAHCQSWVFNESIFINWTFRLSPFEARGSGPELGQGIDVGRPDSLLFLCPHSSA